MNSYEPLLRNVIIRGIDTIGKRAQEAEKSAEGALGKLLKRWNDMEVAEKEYIAGIVVATATTAIAAIAALKSRSSAKKQTKKSVRKTVKAVKKLA